MNLKSACENEFNKGYATMAKKEARLQDKMVSDVHPVGKTEELNTKASVITKKCYGPIYVPFKTEGQNILIPQEVDMSQKDNFKLLYGSQSLGTCTEEEHDYLEDKHFDSETFQYSHEASQKQILVQGVYIRNTSPLTANIKTQP